MSYKTWTRLLKVGGVPYEGVSSGEGASPACRRATTLPPLVLRGFHVCVCMMLKKGNHEKKYGGRPSKEKTLEITAKGVVNMRLDKNDSTPPGAR